MMSEGLSSEEKWHNWYSTALFLYNAYLSAHIEHRESPLGEDDERQDHDEHQPQIDVLQHVPERGMRGSS